jgi:GNAT superfamily N-acetyltransferase
VSPLELRSFAEDHLDAAAELLAARHRHHRATEPLLSERFEDASATRDEVASLWAQDDVSGGVLLRDGDVAGFLLGTRREDQNWGANIWIEPAGYAVDEAELIRDLYAFCSQRWVDEGRTRHYALVPALDDQVDAWFRMSFGAQQAHGIKEVDQRTWPPGARRAEPGDIEALMEIVPLIAEHHGRAPVFSGVDWDEDADELRTMLAAEIADDELGELVYERDGRVVAHFELVSAEKGSMHRSLAQPDRAALLGFAASLPGVRGSGAGVALTEAASAWAHEQGYATMVTDWRETNLLSSRFWPARGFRRSFLRLYRSIP